MIHIPIADLFDKSNRHSDLDVFEAYLLRVGEDWITAPRFMERNQLICVTEGTLTLLVDEARITLTAGEAFVVRRHSTYASCGEVGGRCCFYVVSYTSTIERYEGLYHRVISISRVQSELEAWLGNLVVYDAGGVETEFLLDAGLVMVLERLLSVMQWDPQDRHIADIVEYIAHHLDKPLTVEELGGMFHYSRDYMGHLFRCRYGVSIKQYVNGQKIAYAKRLLATSDMPIGSVGAAVGYPDELLFRKFFKYHVHSTPKYYRERYGSGYES